jgi:hypothetical protein
MAALLERLWSNCAHRFSWPRRAGDGTYYQVCLSCGVRYGYDWSAMRRTARLENEPAPTAKPARRVSVEPPQRVWRPRARRMGLTVPVAVRACGASAWIKGVTRNLSRSGLLLCSDESISAGTAVEFIFEMPQEISGQHESRVLCRGVVVRNQTDRGSGAFFIAVSIIDYRFLPADAVDIWGHRRVRMRGV